MKNMDYCNFIFIYIKMGETTYYQKNKKTLLSRKDYYENNKEVLRISTEN